MKGKGRIRWWGAYDGAAREKRKGVGRKVGGLTSNFYIFSVSSCQYCDYNFFFFRL